MQITAAVAPSQGAPLEIREVELDDPRPDEVRVRMVAVGVCYSDIAIRDQVFPTGLPAVLGHEGTGVVEEVGSGVGNVAVGDHVLLTASGSPPSPPTSTPRRARCSSWTPAWTCATSRR